MAKTAQRRFNRYVKGTRRLSEDRMEHGNDTSCACFEPQAKNGRGYAFSYFADTPTRCSGFCCGNLRRHVGPTRQEVRAPRVEEFHE